ncbi:hypothetical protein CC1G_04998 [Coprinopsis cinerea okayama7|uniref:Homeobox domain-containing protein n=1 Tax=Coprinopsis cinerea (strain Okayama-7 / 130 / ATCC MYA-4618 / FGSC 9003) TaxID=240176 RepID=A8NSG2_COPC7|nr:hypothetical protein CC1G_04998 [Coprinopsis cinerea okayama7\|eukprot:XP_001836005.1 hypothetical protein CC1G_04998 [Coprinopsis cinerea okayama7\
MDPLVEGQTDTKRSIKIPTRASPAQLAILNPAFQKNSAPTGTQFEELAKETGLPKKWIASWFTRQRAKARKARPSHSGSATGPSDMSAGTSEILAIKNELDGVTTIETSVTAVVRVAKRKATKQGQSENPPKRTRKKKDQSGDAVKTAERGPLETIQVKAEPEPGPGVALRYTPEVQSEIIGNQQGTVPGHHGYEPENYSRPSIDNRVHPSNARPSHLDQPSIPHPVPSGGFSDGSMGRQYLQPVDDFRLITYVPPPPVMSGSYQGRNEHGSSVGGSSQMHAKPGHYKSASSTSRSSFSSSRSRPTYDEFFSTPNIAGAPAMPRRLFDNIPSGTPATSSTSLSSFASRSTDTAQARSSSFAEKRQVGNSKNAERYTEETPPVETAANHPNWRPTGDPPRILQSNGAYHIPHVHQGAQGPYPYVADYHPPSIPPAGAQTNSYKQTSSENVSTTMPTLTSPFPTHLNPNLAPLKHVTDIVEPFVDEAGGYSSLMDLGSDQRKVVMERLLDEEMGRKDPFKAAMGLVLASKLGLEWEAPGAA